MWEYFAARWEFAAPWVKGVGVIGMAAIALSAIALLMVKVPKKAGDSEQPRPAGLATPVPAPLPLVSTSGNDSPATSIVGDNNKVTIGGKISEADQDAIAQKTVEGLKRYLDKLGAITPGKPPPAPPPGPLEKFDPVQLTKEFVFGWSLFVVQKGRVFSSAFVALKEHDFQLKIDSVDTSDSSKAKFMARITQPKMKFIMQSETTVSLKEADKISEGTLIEWPPRQFIVRCLRTSDGDIYGVLAIREIPLP